MNVRIAQLLSINAGAWFNGALEMNLYTIKLWMTTQTFSTQEQHTAFQRAKYFVYDQLENTIFVNAADPKCAELAQAGLDITTLPGDPVDQLIGIMLFHKLNAVMEDRIRLLEVEISAGDAVIYLHGENETSDELISPAWWSTADLVHSDFVPADSDKVVSIAQSTAWRDLDLAWPDAPADTAHGNIVVFADFKQPDATE
jgi:hypothetical protein